MGSEGGAWSFLNGCRIVDCSQLLPGPFAGSLLADLGADVIKVEPPGGDPVRRTDARFSAINRNKRSVTIDLKSADGPQRLLDLAATADAVIEGYRPGVMDRLGVGWEALRNRNERLVLCSISGFGQDGPLADRPGHDLNFLALGGFFAVPGELDSDVRRPGVRVGDLLGGLYAALSLSVALASARESGLGQRLDVSLTETTLAGVAPFLLAQAPSDLHDASPLLMGDNGIFRTSDGRRLAFACLEDESWLRFRKRLATSFPRLVTDRWDRRPARTELKREVEEVLRTVFAERPLPWWSDILDELNMPWTPVIEDRAELIGHPQVRARGAIRTTEGALGMIPMARFPTRFSLGLDEFRTSAPVQGEHDDAILAAIDRGESDQAWTSPPSNDRQRRPKPSPSTDAD